MRNKFSIISGNKKQYKFKKPMQKFNFFCTESNKKHTVFLNEEHISIYSAEQENVITMPQYFAIAQLEGIVAFVEKKHKVTLALWHKEQQKFTPIFSSLSLRKALINWRWLAGYYNLPMYLRKEDKTMVYVREKNPLEQLHFYNQSIKLNAKINTKLKLIVNDHLPISQR